MLVVGNADPVGLSRLARGLVELASVAAGAPVHVVVNRMRSSLGWSERDITGMVEGFARLAAVHFLPDDRAAADRALTTGTSIPEAGDSELAGRSPYSAMRWCHHPHRTDGVSVVASCAADPARSGREEQVQAADSERDHRREERQLTGELVLLGEHLDRAFVGGDHSDPWPIATQRPLVYRQERRW